MIYQVNKNRGVTLIELLLVVAILGVTAAIGGDILLTVVRAYRKAQVMGQIEQNGSNASTRIENILRSSVDVEYNSGGNYFGVEEGESRSSNNIKITTLGSDLYIRLGSHTVASSGGGCNNGVIEISSDGSNWEGITDGGMVNVEEVGTDIFTIYNPVNDPPVVSLRFKVSQSCNLDVSASADFNTTVTLRGSYGK